MPITAQCALYGFAAVFGLLAAHLKWRREILRQNAVPFAIPVGDGPFDRPAEGLAIPCPGAFGIYESAPPAGASNYGPTTWSSHAAGIVPNTPEAADSDLPASIRRRISWRYPLDFSDN